MMEIDNESINRIYDALNELKSQNAERSTALAVIAAKLESIQEKINDRHEESEARLNSVSIRVGKLEDGNASHFRWIIGMLLAALGALIAPFFIRR